MATRDIVPGDTLSAIATELGITLEELIADNPQFAANPNLILPGQTLVIPGGSEQEAPDDKAPGVTEFPDPEQEGIPEAVGDTVIPTGARLVRVDNPKGSDAAAEFFLIYDIFGNQVAYRVGDQGRMDALFPAGGIASFDQFTRLSQSGFDQSGFVVVGEVDEILGATESLQSVFERNLRAQGLESLPSWVINDPEASGLLIIAANEGWSEGRTWKALQATQGFEDRFPQFNEFISTNRLSDIRAAVGQYVALETTFRDLLFQHRGPDTNVGRKYIGQLIATGWQPQEIGQVLDAERRLGRNPEALAQLNELLAANGLNTQLGPADFIDLARGKAQEGVFEIINDALRAAELAEQGIDIDTELASFLGAGTSGSVAAEGQFTEQATQAAQFALRFGRELDAQRLGLTRDDVVAAAFNQTSRLGRSAAEVNELLQRFGREQRIQSQGFAGFQSFINQRGRLVIPGT